MNEIKYDTNSTNTPAAEKGITGSGLKYIAIVTMVIDHIGAVILWNLLMQTTDPQSYMQFAYIYQICRYIGRIAFPIFCFLLVEGFVYTHSRRRYAIRLALFALISEVPFDLATQGANGLEFGTQNVFFTLLLGLFALMLMEHFMESKMLRLLSPLVCATLAYVLSTDYGLMGVFLIVIFYLFRAKRYFLYPAVAVWLMVGMMPQQMLNFQLHPSAGMTASEFFQFSVLPSGIMEFFGVISLLFIAKYKGQRGRSLPKYFFYIFYPAHLLVLWGIAKMMGIM